MSPILRNILAVIAGVVVGSIVNMGIVMIGDQIVTYPDGVDPTDFESIKAGVHLLDWHHFIGPFLAHAIGTLVGAFLAAKLGARRKMTLALIIGAWFLIGGITMIVMMGGPLWFKVLDLTLAYFPMAWLGGKLGSGRNRT